MFQLLVAEPYQRLERNLVAEPVILAQFQNLGIDEALDQTKDIGVGAALVSDSRTAFHRPTGS